MHRSIVGCFQIKMVFLIIYKYATVFSCTDARGIHVSKLGCWNERIASISTIQLANIWFVILCVDHNKSNISRPHTHTNTSKSVTIESAMKSKKKLYLLSMTFIETKTKIICENSFRPDHFGIYSLGWYFSFGWFLLITAFWCMENCSGFWILLLFYLILDYFENLRILFLLLLWMLLIGIGFILFWFFCIAPSFLCIELWMWMRGYVSPCYVFFFCFSQAIYELSN